MKEEICQKLLDYVEGTKDFVLEQAPQVFKEILRYEFLMSILQIGLFSLLLTVCATVFWKCYTNPERETYGSRTIETTMGMFLSGLGIFALGVGICCSASSAIQIKMAPKYYILQNILKGKS